MNIKWIYKGFFFFSVLIPGSPSLCTDQDIREDHAIFQGRRNFINTPEEGTIPSATKMEKSADQTLKEIDSRLSMLGIGNVLSKHDLMQFKSTYFISPQILEVGLEFLESQEGRYYLKEKFPVTYYLLKSGRETYYNINNVLNKRASSISDADILKSYNLYVSVINTLEDVWGETKKLGLIPENLMSHSFNTLYLYMPSYQPKIKSGNIASLEIQPITYAEMKAHLKTRPCCYYLMHAAVFTSTKKLKLISEVQNCSQSPRPSIKAKILVSDKPSALDGQMSLISAYWKLSSILLELIRNLTKSEEKPDFKLYERAHLLLIKDTFTKYLGKSICVTPNPFLPNI